MPNVLPERRGGFHLRAFLGTARNVPAKVISAMETPLKWKRQKYSTKEDPKDEDRRKRWKAAIEAYSSNTPIPETLFPVVVKAGTSIPTPEKLQEIAKLPAVPEVCKTKITDLWSSNEYTEETKGEETYISAISYNQISHINATFEVEKIVVWFNKEKRFAVVALGPKLEKVAESGADTSIKQGSEPS